MKAHWRIQVQPLQNLRRRLLTRCAYCGGRSTKRNPTNISLSWHSSKAPWWRGEVGLYHHACAEPQRQINLREQEIARAKTALRVAAKQSEREVVVEGSIFDRDQLPTILGNYMRAADDHARQAKDAAAALEHAQKEIRRCYSIQEGHTAQILALRSQRDALQAQLDNMTTEWGTGYAGTEDRPAIEFDDENVARGYASRRRGHVLKRRLVGPWVEVTD